jgi:hypothetical protein
MGLDPSANEFAVEPQGNEETVVKKDLSDEDNAAATPSLPLIANLNGANEEPSIGEGNNVILTADTFEEAVMKELAIFVSWASQRGGSAPQASTSGKKIVILAIYFLHL